jgi:16S rRNA (guanine527-N7)-methyltransferase
VWPPCLRPYLTPEIETALLTYESLLRETNTRINLVSRKDIEALREHHILPSLLLLCLCPIEEGARVLDLGTGGGLPGIPLSLIHI